MCVFTWRSHFKWHIVIDYTLLRMDVSIGVIISPQDQIVPLLTSRALSRLSNGAPVSPPNPGSGTGLPPNGPVMVVSSGSAPGS
jgi:hypothetical protein